MALSGDTFRKRGGFHQSSYTLVDEALIEALNTDNKADLFISGTIDYLSGILFLRRGDMTEVVVSLDIFQPSGDGTAPDFYDFSIIDYGLTLKFGEYEASSEWVIHRAGEHE